MWCFNIRLKNILYGDHNCWVASISSVELILIVKPLHACIFMHIDNSKSIKIMNKIITIEFKKQ